MTAIGTYKPNQLIQDAAKHGELVVFVGAGASKLCGSPDWRGFANKVVDALEKAGKLSFLEAEQLRGLGESRRTLSIALTLAKEHGVDIDFDGILHPSKPAAIGTELYELLSSLQPVFVTTNYDKWLDEAGPEELATEPPAESESKPVKGPTKRRKYYLREHLTSDRLTERGAVIHLHGTYTVPDSMVVSLKDYIAHYADGRVQAFLSEMFRNYTVLFVGYGLAELEVLDHIVRSNESLTKGAAEERHFLLYAHRSTESVQTQFMKHFFRDQCGVQVIPYCIDSKGYQELVEVFKAWNPELDVRDPTILDFQTRLDRYVAAPTQDNRGSAMRLVQKHLELVAYFINSLKDVVWFTDLDTAGYFDIEHSPGVKVIETERGPTYQADGWPALRYLELIAAFVSGAQAVRVADIVRSISSDAQRRGVDNWRTWWSLATILSRLPLEVIAEADIAMTRYWLGGQFEANMVGQELGQKLLPRLLDSSEPNHWEHALSLVDALSMLRRPEGKI
ncbi:SIR2 family protein [Paraburkholderia sp. RL18-085-BIA-A]|uniref:SIR2 family protein n=1 Tax=Paraburkholderia sp. RL18-085-BIA-A TaxID=3031633 RepID=UPI0038B8E0E1